MILARDLWIDFSSNPPHLPITIIKITKSFDSIDDITDEKNTVEFDFVKFLNDEDGYKNDPVIFSKNGDGFVVKIVFDYSGEDTSSEDILNP